MSVHTAQPCLCPRAQVSVTATQFRTQCPGMDTINSNPLNLQYAVLPYEVLHMASYNNKGVQPKPLVLWTYKHSEIDHVCFSMHSHKICMDIK